MRTLFHLFGRSPAFALAAVFSIALAVGANAAIFSIVNALWLRPLPVLEPERLVVPYRPVVHSTDGEVLDSFLAHGIPPLRRLDAFSDVTFELNTSGMMALWEPSVRLADGDKRLSTAVVAHNYFRALGVTVRGRDFTAADERETEEVAGVISNDFWRFVLRNDQAAIGRTLETTSGRIRIVGIAPRGFRGARLGHDRDLWLTVAGLASFSDMGHVPNLERLMPVTIYARLREGVSIQTAQDQARTVLDRRTTLRSLGELTFPLRSTADLSGQSAILRVLWIAALMVLLLGFANLAALIVARAESRRHELSIRRCLGARRGRLMLDAAVEAAAICFVGLAGGLIVRYWLLEAISDYQIPAGITIDSLNAGLDWRVLVFGATVAVVAAAIAAAGALPMLRAPDLSRLLAASATSGTRATVRLRQLLLAAHVAVCTALLGCGTALAWNVQRALRSDLGYQSRELLYVSLRPRLSTYERTPDDDLPRNLSAAIDRALEATRALPQIRGASYGQELLGGQQVAYEGGLVIAGRQLQVPLSVKRVGASYLTTIGARFIEGRDLRKSDEAESVDPMDVVRRKAEAASSGSTYRPPQKRPATVIDSTLAERLWPGESAVGRTLMRAGSAVTYSVVGVVEPLRYSTTSERTGSMFEVQAPEAVDIFRPQYFVVRTIGPARLARSTVLAVFRKQFGDALQLSVHDAASLIADERARERMGAMVFSWFGMAAAVLGLTGIYGLVAFLLLRSRRELGIRAALGADKRRLFGLLASRAVTPSAIGACAGMLLALWASTTVSAIVGGVADLSPWASVFAGMALVIASAATASIAARGIRRLREADLLRAE